MIFVHTGKTGTGKTFDMVKMAEYEWRHGVDVYSNTVLLFDESYTWWEHIWEAPKRFYKWAMGQPYERIKRGKIEYFETISEILEVRNGLILFDEAQVLFNARNWESLPDEFQYKLQQHRKHRLDLVCTTQNMGTIDLAYRRLVQFWTHYEMVFQIGKSPRVWFALIRKKVKDVDELYLKVDDLTVTDLKISYKIIHFWSKRLYDTMYDIGFKRFQTIWIMDQTTGEKPKLSQSFVICPKKWSLADASRATSSSKSRLGLNRSNLSSKTSKNYATRT